MRPALRHFSRYSLLFFIATLCILIPTQTGIGATPSELQRLIQKTKSHSTPSPLTVGEMTGNEWVWEAQGCSSEFRVVESKSGSTALMVIMIITVNNNTFALAFGDGNIDGKIDGVGFAGGDAITFANDPEILKEGQRKFDTLVACALKN